VRTIKSETQSGLTSSGGSNCSGESGRAITICYLLWAVCYVVYQLQQQQWHHKSAAQVQAIKNEKNEKTQ